MRIDTFSPAALVAGTTSGRSSSAPRTAQASNASLAAGSSFTTAALARGLGVTVGALDSLISSGGSMTVAAGGAAALAGMPLAADGTPDFEAIIAAGGTVKGAIPPDSNSNSRSWKVTGRPPTSPPRSPCLAGNLSTSRA
jgi:hypothetical protein